MLSHGSSILSEGQLTVGDIHIILGLYFYTHG